jgi:hypothetical protein
MRLRSFLVLGACLAFSTPALARTKVHTMTASKIAGKPAFEDGKQIGLFAWHDKEGFHVRWTTDGAPTLFTGRIDTDRPLKDLQRLQKLGSGWVKQHGDRIIMFSATTRGDTDGFDLTIPGGRHVQMEITIEGKKPQVEQVTFGAKNTHPRGFPLLLKLR